MRLCCPHDQQYYDPLRLPEMQNAHFDYSSYRMSFYVLRSHNASQDLPRYCTNILDMPPLLHRGVDNPVSLPFPVALLPSPVHKRLGTPLSDSPIKPSDVHDGATCAFAFATACRFARWPWMGTGHACRTCFMMNAYASTICPRLAGLEVFPA